MRTINIRTIFLLISILPLAWAVTGCRSEYPVLPSEPVEVNPWDTVSGDVCGFFLLNEGNMGSNKASLDYYDYTTGVYTRNIGNQLLQLRGGNGCTERQAHNEDSRAKLPLSCI